uniref:Peptidyl-prolyl cis-trans isomerase n=1 Tax=Syphacia muris TaxID=451379 RepID=A0A0N5AND2_9BILA
MLKERRRAFLDITIDGRVIGRIVLELFNDVAPKTCQNFLMLCTGMAGIGKVSGKPLHYKGSTFHRVIKNFMIQGGDFTKGDGTGGESIYGGMFDDEEFVMKHDEPFMLSMANKGPNTNGSQFFITTTSTPHLNNVHVVFGKVVSGFEVVKEIEHLKTDSKYRPIADVVILNCGELVKKTKKRKKSNSDASSTLFRSTTPEKRRNNKVEKHKESKESSSKRSRRDNDFRQYSRPRLTRSGHKIKGRGALRFRSDRDRSRTPPHWRREQVKYYLHCIIKSSLCCL